jgi:hypothetical protein
VIKRALSTNLVGSVNLKLRKSPMSNKTRLLISFSLVVSTLLSPAALCAQTSTGDWSAVRNLPNDSRVSVRLKTGKTVDGKIASVTETTITLANKKQGEIRREDVQTVHQLIKQSAMPATLIGAGVGAGIGAGIGAAADATDDGFEKIDHAVTVGLAVVGAVVGAVGGYFIGRKASKRVLIYESK